MTSRDSIQSVEEDKRLFEQNLKAAIELGSYPNSGDGLSSRTFDAITEIADSYPETKPELVKKARQCFADYLAWLAAD